MPDQSNVRQTAARAFIRSLNILLKFARMYDFGHPRTVKQYDTAWAELRTALGTDDEAGMLLAVSGDQLLLDGTPLESAQAEKSFARMLSVAGIASIHFSPKLTHASLQKFVRAFPTSSGSKPVQLAEQLKESLQGDQFIHVNEVCFVPADSAVAKSTMAAQLAARTLGMNAEQTDQLLNDPEKLLQLIVAAEGTKGGGAVPEEAAREGADRAVAAESAPALAPATAEPAMALVATLEAFTEPAAVRGLASERVAAKVQEPAAKAARDRQLRDPLARSMAPEDRLATRAEPGGTLLAERAGARLLSTRVRADSG